MKLIFTLLASLFIFLTVNAQITTDGLVAWYPFNGNANDESGNGNNGTVNGATLTPDRFGTANSAYSFNGTNNNIVVPHSSDQNSLPQSISIWFKTNQTASSGISYIISKYNGNCNGYYIGLDLQTGILMPRYAKNCTSNLIYNPLNNIRDNQWHLIVMITDSSQMSIYIDNQFVNSVNWTGIPGSTTTNTELRFGANNPITYYYKGSLDDIRIYNRALTPTEVNSIYNESPCSGFTGASITGTLSYNNSISTPLTYSTVFLKNESGVVIDSTLSDWNGVYQFCSVENGNYSLTAKTDKPWGGVNSTDALLVLKQFVQMVHLEGLYLAAANVDMNPNINSIDAYIVQKRFILQINSFPVGDWVFENPLVSITGPSVNTVNIKGICYGDVNGSYLPSIINQMPCPGIPAFNYGGQLYNTVLIGDQCWMKENLNIGSMINGTQNMTNNGTIEKYCYNNEVANCNVYGGLYQWKEMMQYSLTPGIQGICPAGWHLPINSEFNALADFIGGASSAGGKLKETGFLHWDSPNSGATNQSGFTAIGSGYRYINDGGFYDLKRAAHFWNSDEQSTGIAYNHFLSYGYSYIEYGGNPHNAGLSVRCLKNCMTNPTASAGIDQLGILGTSATLNANSPIAGETGSWSIISGSGGLIANINNPASGFTGLEGETYSLLWQISSNCGLANDTVVISFYFASGLPCPGLASLQHGGDTYNTVQIGSQCWMRENLNIGTMIHGSVYASDNDTLEKYCYGNNPANCEIYGGLYAWHEMMNYSTVEGSQGICPTGWHIPSVANWDTLIAFLGGDNAAGGHLKETGLEHWLSPNTGATNSSGFTLLGCGFMQGPNYYANIKNLADMWTSSIGGGYYAWIKGFGATSAGVTQWSEPAHYGFGVRCIKD
jgi:uncharacterized protein (TIGR02145 family)